MEQLSQNKELEALERIKNYEQVFRFEEDLSVIEKALKALEIIEQNILKITPFEEYGCTCIYVAKPTKEKYDLLKEVLKGE